MYHCCKAIDKCCQDCCECLNQCCGSYCECIGQVFSTPFSFCTFLSFFITIIPTILMIVAQNMLSSYDCEQPIQMQMIIQGIINAINFFFCIYLMCQYGQYQQHKENSEWNQMNVMQKTFHLLLYDFVVCFYIFGIIFFVIWTSIGHSYYDQEPQDSVCYKQDDGFVMIAHLINLLATDFFLVFGFIAFLITLTMYACDDGSCTCEDTGNCCCGVLTCGLCYEQPQQKKYIEERKQAANDNRNQYNQERTDWIGKGQTLFGKMQFWEKAPAAHPPPPPHPGNYQMNPINPGMYNGGPPIQPAYNNYQPYAPPPPQPVYGYQNQAPYPPPPNPIMSNPVQPNYNYPGQSGPMNHQNQPYAYNNAQVAQNHHQPPQMEYGFQDPNSGMHNPPPPPPKQEEKQKFLGLF